MYIHLLIILNYRKDKVFLIFSALMDDMFTAFLTQVAIQRNKYSALEMNPILITNFTNKSHLGTRLFLCFIYLYMGLSLNKIKYIRSLKEKKFRIEHQVFVAEGSKLVSDLIKNCRCQLLVALPEWISAHPGIQAEEIVVASTRELNKATLLKTPPPVIAVFYRPEHAMEQFNASDQLIMVLDGIQDPGNMGTIIRVADWFGIEHIVCSLDTADLYNPKTVQATMGAIARAKVIYTDVVDFLRQNSQFPIYGTFLDGDSIYTEKLSANGIIVMGSEGKGISTEVEKTITHRLLIPSYPLGATSSESLNVAAATAVICSEFRRRRAVTE